MRLSASAAAASRLQVEIDFPSPEGAGVRTHVRKRPYIDQHLPDHPGYDPAKADIPLQVRPVPVNAGSVALFPIAYLVCQAPHSTIGAHFHRVNQFQVFVGGSGGFGGVPAAAPMVHYANAWSAYGPIRAGAEGIDYFTLRPAWDKGAAWMPESAAQLRAVPDRKVRNVIYPKVEAWSAPADGAPRVTCLGSDADGLGVWVIDAAAGQAMPGLPPAAGGGQYWLVLEGGLQPAGAGADASLGPLDLVFLSTDEEPFAARATGPTQVVVTQFPRTA